MGEKALADLVFVALSVKEADDDELDDSSTPEPDRLSGSRPESWGK